MIIISLVSELVLLWVLWRVFCWLRGLNAQPNPAGASVVETLRSGVSSAMDRAAGVRPSFSLEQELQDVTGNLRARGLERCNMIVGIDFTDSARFTGRQTFGGKNLHYIDDSPDPTRNPYESALIDIMQAMSGIDSDGRVPGYAFGCEKTQDMAVDLFTAGEIDARSYKPILTAYRAAAVARTKSGPTSFAPLIREAAWQAERDLRFHLLLIICDGMVSDECWADTCNAIAEAAVWAPLAIVIVGVGDGPWDDMKHLDNLPGCECDIVHFVAHAETMNATGHVGFAKEALCEVPNQYAMAARRGKFQRRRALRPNRPLCQVNAVA